MKPDVNRRILLIDDSDAIHEDFKKILGEPDETAKSLAEMRAAFSAQQAPAGPPRPTFEIDSAFQGEQGFEMLMSARAEKRPYAMAFVDVRMPPGWDGIETIKRLWTEDEDLQVVVCTAYSDYSWEETVRKLGQSDRLLILKKPFDPIEIHQLASALTEKWNAKHRETKLVAELKQAEQEARAYASSLETVNRALETSNMSAARASEMKSDIIMNLGDEIHEHLATVLERVDLLRGTDGERRFDSLESITGACRHLIRALDEIMDITLMESGQLHFESEGCAPLAIAREVVDSLRGYADKKKLTIELRCEGPVPERVQSSPARIRQILAHLVANGIKYTSEGGVQVVLGMEPTSDWQNSLLRFQVADSGSGIPKEFHGRIFEPFAGRSARGTQGGLGLGLALSKRLARLLGGDLKVTSQPGQGTSFTLILQTGDLSGVRMIHA